MPQSLSSKRERVKSFLDDVYNILINNEEKNLTNILGALKKHNLTSEYATSLKLAKIIDKRDGFLVWLLKKPNLKLADALINLTAHLTVKRNDNFRTKKIENVYSFMRNVYRKTKDRPIDSKKLNSKDILDKYELTSEYMEALLIKNILGTHKIITSEGELDGYKWDKEEPKIEDAQKIYNFVMNNIQKNKKISKESEDSKYIDSMKYIKDYTDFQYAMKTKK